MPTNNLYAFLFSPIRATESWATGRNILLCQQSEEALYITDETLSWTRKWGRLLKILLDNWCRNGPNSVINLMEHFGSWKNSWPSMRILLLRISKTMRRLTKCYHRIDTGGARPIRQSSRRIRPTKQVEVNSVQRRGIVEESDGSWSPAIVLVRKKNGKLRVCVDCRKLNDVINKDCFPPSRIRWN
jgi:hypothetical protein